jgi:hypothetical protein
MPISSKKSPLLLLALFILFTGCGKDFLNVSPNTSLAIPTNLSEYRALLDHDRLFLDHPALGDIGCDDYYLPATILQGKNYLVQNAYRWTPNTYENGSGIEVGDWNNPYRNIYISNIVLEGLPSITMTTNNEKEYKEIKGAALFIRAFNFYNLAQLFSEPYIPSSAEKDLGLPIRLSSDFNKNINRSSVKDTYDKIIEDLLNAKELLSSNVPSANYINRPSKPAAFALLARTYLTMQKYLEASIYADSSLILYKTLLDFNTINSAPTLVFRNNPEEIIRATQINYSTLGISTTAVIDSNLYKSYDENDLRKSLYFRLNTDGTPSFRGNYSGTSTNFIGIATDEIYLIRAEAKARLGNNDGAMSDLNTLLVKRWKTGKFVPYIITNGNDALNKILTERRKELLLRGLRWGDLRRLNQDSRFAVVLKREINGQKYTLLPNDIRYALLIPSDEIQLGQISQNKR